MFARAAVANPNSLKAIAQRGEILAGPFYRCAIFSF
jgi:hypothetical protein